MGLPASDWLSLDQAVQHVINVAAVGREDAQQWLRNSAADGSIEARGDAPLNIHPSAGVRAAHPHRSRRQVDPTAWNGSEIDWSASIIGPARYFDVRVARGSLMAQLGAARPSERAVDLGPISSASGRGRKLALARTILERAFPGGWAGRSKTLVSPRRPALRCWTSTGTTGGQSLTPSNCYRRKSTTLIARCSGVSPSLGRR